MMNCAACCVPAQVQAGRGPKRSSGMAMTTGSLNSPLKTMNVTLALNTPVCAWVALCGIVVPESQLVKVGGKNVLLVKRFDREHGNRVHFASTRTILIAEGIAEDAMAYADIADAARRLSVVPKNDCHQIFRRMVFNVLIENTDDHD